jgi:Ca2+-dependent lipid-binding protein
MLGATHVGARAVATRQAPRQPDASVRAMQDNVSYSMCPILQDTYAVATCSCGGGHVRHQTPVERNSLQPRWNQRFAFDNVALTDCVSVAVFDRKKISADICLGQVGGGKANSV